MHKLAPLALALAILTLPGASAIDPTSTALGVSLGDGTTELLASVQGHAPGDVLPLCQGDEAPEGAILLGVVDEAKACFDVIQSLPMNANTEGGPTCDVVHGGVAIFPEPRVDLPDPDESCIYGIIDDVRSLITNPPGPQVPITIQIGG